MIAWPAFILLTIVSAILFASHHARFAPLFKWLPVPLWCYALPMAAVTLGWLPRSHAVYAWFTGPFLPVALALLLLGIDLPSVMRSGGKLLAAAAVGAVGIMAGAVLGVWIVRSWMPADAWKGAGALAATWTGGTMNMLAARSLLDVPDAMFAPLVVVDALTTYTWMALLVAASALQTPLNRWLGAVDSSRGAVDIGPGASGQGAALERIAGVGVALALAAGSIALARRLPMSSWISSANAWAVLLVTTGTLVLSLVPAIRRIGRSTDATGYALLYLVLAATGAQARPESLWATPAWLLVGAVTVSVHAAVLLAIGKLLRIPLGALATASQANIGGVVSAPLVAAVYHRALAPAGLLLALAGNALGTYLGWIAAMVSRRLLGD